MPPSFLNSREDAMLLWTVAFLVWVVSKDPRGIGGSFLNVVRAFFVPPILLVLGSALLYSAAIAYVAHDAGLWHATALKATVYWFLGTGTVLIADAASTTARNSREWLREVLRRVIAVTVVTEFVVNAYTLPLAFELVLMLVLLVFVAMQAYAPYNPTVTPATRRFIDGVLATVGMIYFGYFVASALHDPGGLATRQTAEDFFVGPVLTVALIPFLWSVAWLSRRQEDKLHEHVRARLMRQSVAR